MVLPGTPTLNHLGTQASPDADPEPPAVWRVCRVITGDCKRCPASESIGGDDCVRGCYLQAVECINTVETGNPWRKTSDVREPWVVLANTPNPERSGVER